MATSVRTFLADFPPNLGFEATAGQHYMLIDSYESKNAVTTAEGQKLSSIGLYIISQISSSKIIEHYPKCFANKKGELSLTLNYRIFSIYSLKYSINQGSFLFSNFSQIGFLFASIAFNIYFVSSNILGLI